MAPSRADTPPHANRPETAGRLTRNGKKLYHSGVFRYIKSAGANRRFSLLNQSIK
jgi:hypothetical protein